MSIPIYQVDAFTSIPFTGNPAGVCVLDQPRPDKWTQAVAMEMNLSETAFLLPGEDGFSLRWFTPRVEVDLCGHATLASAHLLWEAGYLPPAAPARFHTRSGLLTAARRGEWIEMDFPADPAGPATMPPRMAEALGITPSWVGRCRFTYLALLDSEQAVRDLRPDLQLLESSARGSLIVTAASASGEYDFVSRFFAPGIGIPEDPVTGAAHCCLSPFWVERLGKSEVVGYQCSARGGTVRARPAGDRVLLGGQAVTVMRGHMLAV